MEICSLMWKCSVNERCLSLVWIFHACSLVWTNFLSQWWQLNVSFSLCIISWPLNFTSLVKILFTVVTVEWLFLGVESFMVSQLTSFVKLLVTVVTVEWFMIVQITDMSKFFVTGVAVFILKLMECYPKWNLSISLWICFFW